MKTAKEWDWEHTKICAADPAVSGQLLPSPQMVAFIKQVQDDALMNANEQIEDGIIAPLLVEWTRLKRMEIDYNELIMAVAKKFEGETRHQTALKYINAMENTACEQPAQSETL